MTKTLICAMDVSPLKNNELYSRAHTALPSERQKKADACRFEKDRLLCVGAGILLEKTLREFGVPENDLRFTAEENGKPFLTARNDVYFNLSHAGTYVLCAVSDVPVGCDIEEITNYKDSLAKRIFSTEEYAYVAAKQTQEGKNEAFFRYWTLRESYMKYTGLGLALPLSRFEIRRGDDVSVWLDGEKQRVFFREYTDVPGYACSVCAKKEITSGGIQIVQASDLIRNSELFKIGDQKSEIG